MTKALGNAGQEQRAAGDRLEVLVGFGKSDEQVPPVVDERDQTGRKPAPREIVGRKPAPPPLVLQFIEGVFAIRPVAIELAKGDNLGVERSHQRRVLIDLALVDIGKGKSELAGEVIPMVVDKLLLDAPAQKHDTART